MKVVRRRKPFRVKRGLKPSRRAALLPASTAAPPTIELPESRSGELPPALASASKVKVGTADGGEAKASSVGARLAPAAVVPALASIGVKPAPAGPPLQIPPILLEGDEPTRLSPPGPGEKYALGPTIHVAQVESPETELPEAYGTGRLFLVARDPHCLYAYWDLTLEQQRVCNGLSVHHHLVVRVYLETASGGPIDEIHVHPESRHWFIHVGQPGRTYVAELGYYLPGGLFRTAALSEPVATPSGFVAEQKVVEFATIDLAPGTGGPVDESLPQPPPVGRDSTTASPPPPPSAGREFILAIPAQSARLAQESTSERTSNFPLEEPWSPPRAQATSPVRAEAKTSRAGTTSFLGPEWTPQQESALAELIGWTLVKKQWPGSEEIVSLLQGRRPQPVSSLEAARFAAPLEAGPGPSSPAGGLAPEISSPPGAALPVQKAFWFSVNAELVIYGATEPDARVTIGGRPIRLRPDGSFSYRFALPDGHYRLPISATAAHGDARHAELEFYRGTHRRGEVSAHPQDPTLKTPQVENVG